MTGIAVALGIWLTDGGVFPFPPEITSFEEMTRLMPANIPNAPGVLDAFGISFGITVDCWIASLLLMLAAMAAAAYGNVINDIIDVKSDRVSHPNRPLANGTMSPRAAKAFAAALAAVSLACGAMVSAFYLCATLAPLALLTLYSIYFKRTRIIGNIVVSALTGYALLFGALCDKEVEMLILPAILAFLLSLCREIAKDVQDAEGDRAAGWTTSAGLRPGTIRLLLAAASAAYLLIVFMPSRLFLRYWDLNVSFKFFSMADINDRLLTTGTLPVSYTIHYAISDLFGNFGTAYLLVCLAAVVPLHIYWTALALRRGGIAQNAGRIGLLLKTEMAAGLAALALDKAIYYFII